MTNIGRMFFGSILLLFYMLAYLSTQVMSIVVQLLILLNPFSLLVSDYNGGALNGAYNSYMQSGVQGMFYAATATIREPFQGLVGTLQRFGVMITIPLSFAILAFGILMFSKKADAGKKIKFFLLRALFIIAGIPLLGLLYSTLLVETYNAFHGANSSTSVSGLNRAIAGAYIDVESWAYNRNFNLPSGVILSVENSNSGDKYEVNMTDREFAAKVNAYSGSPISSGDPKDANNPNIELKYEQLNNEKSLKGQVDNSHGIGKDNLFNFLWGSYITNKTINPLNYESKYLEELKRKGNSDYGNFSKGTKKYSDPNNFKDGELFWGTEATDKQDFKGSMARDDSGSLTGSINGDKYTYRGNGNQGKGLSSLSTYSFLSSSFTPSEIELKQPTDNSMIYASKIAGKGVGIIFVYLDVLLYFMMISMIAFVYAYGMAFNTFKRLFSMMSKMPAVLVGSMRGIVNTIILVFMVVFDVVITFMLFQVLMHLVTNFSTVIENVIIRPEIGTIGNSVQMAAGLDMAKYVGGLMLGIFIKLVMTFAALKLRRQVITGVDEAVKSMVSKFFETSPSQNIGSMGQADGANDRNGQSDQKGEVNAENEGVRKEDTNKSKDGENGQDSENKEKGKLEADSDNDQLEKDDKGVNSFAEQGAAVAGEGDAGDLIKSQYGYSLKSDGTTGVTKAGAARTAKAAVDRMNGSDEKKAALKRTIDSIADRFEGDVSTPEGLQEFSKELGNIGIPIAGSEFVKADSIGKDLAKTNAKELGTIVKPAIPSLGKTDVKTETSAQTNISTVQVPSNGQVITGNTVEAPKQVMLKQNVQVNQNNQVVQRPIIPQGVKNVGAKVGKTVAHVSQIGGRTMVNYIKRDIQTNVMGVNNRGISTNFKKSTAQAKKQIEAAKKKNSADDMF